MKTAISTYICSKKSKIAKDHHYSRPVFTRAVEEYVGNAGPGAPGRLEQSLSTAESPKEYAVGKGKKRYRRTVLRSE
jgi:hypothetical protein